MKNNKVTKSISIPREFLEEWLVWYPLYHDGQFIVEALMQACNVPDIDQTSYIMSLYDELFKKKQFYKLVRDRYVESERFDEVVNMPPHKLIQYHPLPIKGKEALILPYETLHKLRDEKKFREHYKQYILHMISLSEIMEGNEHKKLFVL